jgi:hypothetical protein
MGEAGVGREKVASSTRFFSMPGSGFTRCRVLPAPSSYLPATLVSHKDGFSGKTHIL